MSHIIKKSPKASSISCNADNGMDVYRSYMDRITVDARLHASLCSRFSPEASDLPTERSAGRKIPRTSSGRTCSRRRFPILRFGSLAACCLVLLLCLSILPDALPNRFSGLRGSGSNGPAALDRLDILNGSDAETEDSGSPDSVPPAAEESSVHSPENISDPVFLYPGYMDSFDEEECLSAVWQELSFQEALSDPVFGGYLPSVAPEGFTAESFTLYEQTPSLTCLWTRGHNELFWTVRNLTDSDSQQIVNPQERERYDMSLYTIPLCDSVPEELRATVDNPIFRLEDLTQELVGSRAYRVSDSGDTDGLRTNFSVCTGDILITVTAKGVDPSWLYQQLDALR